MAESVLLSQNKVREIHRHSRGVCSCVRAYLAPRVVSGWG